MLELDDCLNVGIRNMESNMNTIVFKGSRMTELADP